MAREGDDGAQRGRRPEIPSLCHLFHLLRPNLRLLAPRQRALQHARAQVEDVVCPVPIGVREAQSSRLTQVRLGGLNVLTVNVAVSVRVARRSLRDFDDLRDGLRHALRRLDVAYLVPNDAV